MNASIFVDEAVSPQSRILLPGEHLTIKPTGMKISCNDWT